MYTRSTLNQAAATHRGFSFVEVLVTAALVALVFGGLFAAVQAMINLISDSKAKASAVSIATERLEYIRSLAYDDVGTVSGVPAGNIPQHRSIVRNGISFQERVLVEYIDDPADGEAGADSNGIVADYKRVKVEYSWPGRNGTSSLALVSTVVPPGVETTAGGGTLRVYVNDADVQPVAGASVRFVNQTATATIDTVRFTNAAGVAQLGGAPALSEYEIYVSLAGYSSDGTSFATGTLSSPNQPVVSVAEASVTTQYFQIDELSDLAITTVSSPTYASESDTFDSAAQLASSSQSTVSGGAVVLAGGPGSYASSGTAIASTTAPSPLDRWQRMDWLASTTASTTALLQLRYPTGTSSTALVPDGDLPGNSAGFGSSPVDLTGLDVATYPELALSVQLTSIDGNETPQLHEWSLTYASAVPTLSSIPITVTGAKVLGTDASGGDVYKNVFSGSTDGSGEWALDDIEYDAYTVVVDDPSYDILEACPSSVIALEPNTTEAVEFTVGSVAGPRLLVSVTDASDRPVPDAVVRLQQPGYDESQTTSLCGQTFFSGGGLGTGSSTVTVSKSGYTTVQNAGVPISATSTHEVQIN